MISVAAWKRWALRERIALVRYLSPVQFTGNEHPTLWPAELKRTESLVYSGNSASRMTSTLSWRGIYGITERALVWWAYGSMQLEVAR